MDQQMRYPSSHSLSNYAFRDFRLGAGEKIPQSTSKHFLVSTGSRLLSAETHTLRIGLSSTLDALVLFPRRVSAHEDGCPSFFLLSTFS